MKNNYYSNYQGYLKNGNRVASFGIEKEGKLEMFLLYCSKHDSFSKQTAKQLYERYLKVGINKLSTEFHRVILLLPINESDSASYTFQNYIRENFYKKRIKTALCLEECLIKGSTKIVTKTKKFPKLLR